MSVQDLLTIVFVTAALVAIWNVVHAIAVDTQKPYQSMSEAEGEVVVLGVVFALMIAGMLVLTVVSLPLRLVWWIAEKIERRNGIATSA